MTKPEYLASLLKASQELERGLSKLSFQAGSSEANASRDEVAGRNRKAIVAINEESLAATALPDSADFIERSRKFFESIRHLEDPSKSKQV